MSSHNLQPFWQFATPPVKLSHSWLQVPKVFSSYVPPLDLKLQPLQHQSSPAGHCALHASNAGPLQHSLRYESPQHHPALKSSFTSVYPTAQDVGSHAQSVQ